MRHRTVLLQAITSQNEQPRIFVVFKKYVDIHCVANLIIEKLATFQNGEFHHQISRKQSQNSFPVFSARFYRNQEFSQSL